MRLKSFRVRNYRSINDSGAISVEDRTALVGRNESGKTNLLLALKALKPAGQKSQGFDFAKDFPRDRHPEEFSTSLPVVDTTWALSQAEQTQLGKLYSRAKAITEVQVGCYFNGNRHVSFVGLPPRQASMKQAKKALQTLEKSIGRTKRGNELQDAISQIKKALGASILLPTHATGVVKAVTNFSTAYQAAGIELTPTAKNATAKIRRLARAVISGKDAAQAARNWAVEQMPVFVYLSDYPHVEGHQDVPGHLARRSQGSSTESDANFEKLMKVAGLDPQELQSLLGTDHEKRQQLANRAGAVVTRKIRELWTDRNLKIRFNLDAQHFDTLISDPSAHYDVEVNLNERSRGFRWFFSFYVTLAADTRGGFFENSVLLFDEPGLYLHALGQRNLLQHFSADFDNQIIYTTHSPFMLPERDISGLRTVTISEESGTAVHNNPVGDAKTMFPLLHALGVEISQSLFVSEWNLVVEGVTDHWYLSSVSEYFEECGKKHLPSWLAITPAGSSSKVPYMVTLLTSNHLKMIVLLDEESDARNIADNLVKDAKLAREENVLFVSAGFGDAAVRSADIEDMLDPKTFHVLVKTCYEKDLDGKQLQLNENIPRIVKRYEDAFGHLGLQFRKARIARLFFSTMGKTPDSLLTEESISRFETLFQAIISRLEILQRRDRKPFQ